MEHLWTVSGWFVIFVCAYLLVRYKIDMRKKFKNEKNRRRNSEGA